ncbi:FAST kinase domain-containing protein 1, mitochondrial isoform X2 [Heterocephalus glaber]|uniref:FAST kinase domain-containing protein 1, mitochondrial isoform X2 n=1 Tax=Heterocephalus glaber TaxID=10181 RepID=A0AAX6R3G5_HETGA|nr:FAST kinase domain-containing protein 1, mitochondrial isoform X2 [Heterocephalus glaber]
MSSCRWLSLSKDTKYGSKMALNMFRLRATCPVFWKVFQFRPLSCEPLIVQMSKCTDEEEIFDLIERNKATLSEKQVGHAFNVLWRLQTQKTSSLKNVESVRDHPQFPTLYNLTTNKIEAMSDDTLVNVLHIAQQFAVAVHDPLVESLVTEAWKRLERSLSVLMISISSLISQHFQEKLVKKTELLFDTIDSSQVTTARKIVQFLGNVKCSHFPLLERCDKVFLSNVNHLDLDSIRNILAAYRFLQFYSFAFILMAKKRLTEMIPLFNHPANFVKLFVTLGPLAGPQEKKQLESTMLLMSEELTSQQALEVVVAMEEMESRNSHLIKKIASVLHKNLENYTPTELLEITQTLIFLHFPSKEVFMKLRELLFSYLKVSVQVKEIVSLSCALSMLPSPHTDEAVMSRIEALLPQCDLSNLNDFATSVLRWIHYDHMYLSKFTGKQLKLLQKLDHYSCQRLQQSNNFHLLWEELKYSKGDWFHQLVVEETIAAFQCLMDEINYTNVARIGFFISRTNYLSTSLLDRIAAVVVQQIEKIHPFSILGIILPFSILNYDPPQKDEFFGLCMQCLHSHLGTLDPHTLVFLGFSLATLEYFPEDLLKAIFNIQFLASLDSQLEILTSSLSSRVQLRLMELNRAVCLECPEFQIPWFHDRFCQQQYNKDIGSMNGAQQQIYKLLAEILGGPNFVKASVLSPYYYAVEFECILNKRKKPLPYGTHNVTLGKPARMFWESNIQIVGSSLPPGAERIAFEFLDSKAFCRNIPHLKGKSAMKKRHLEILGYRVIQIPHFEWNSMALSTKDARMDYLRQHIFGEGTS